MTTFAIERLFYNPKIQKLLMDISKSISPHPLLYYVSSDFHENTTNLPSPLCKNSEDKYLIVEMLLR